MFTRNVLAKKVFAEEMFAKEVSAEEDFARGDVTKEPSSAEAPRKPSGSPHETVLYAPEQQSSTECDATTKRSSIEVLKKPTSVEAP